MKRFMSILLVLLIAVLPQIGSAQIRSVSGPVSLDPELEDTFFGISDILPHKGEVYTASSGYLLRQKNEDSFEAIAKLVYAEEKRDEEGEPLKPQGKLLSDEEQLYLINDKGLYTLSIEGDIGKLTLLQELKEKDGDFVDYNASALNQGKLYYISNNSEGNSQLQILKLGESKAESIPLAEETGYPVEIRKYGNSIYLVTQQSILALENKELKSLYDLSEIGQNFFPHTCYVASEDAFYLVNDSYLVKLKDGKSENITVLSSTVRDVYALDDHTLLLHNEMNIETLDLRNAKMPEKVLRVFGLENQDLFTSYNKAHPEMPAVRKYGYFEDPQAFSADMKGENKSDVYFGELYAYIDALLKHEYVEPLNANTALMDMASRMYPYLRENISKDDKVYMMPYNVYNYGTTAPINNYVYSIKAWETLGLTENDVPKTYAAFVALMDRLYTEKNEVLQENKIGMIDNPYSFPQQMKLRVLNLIAVNASKKGESPKFDTPEVNALLDAINNSEFMQFLSDESAMEDSLANIESYVFQQAEDVVDLPEGYRAMPLTIGEDDVPYTLANATVMYVNALSENKTEAMSFIQYAMEHLSERMQTYVFTDKNEPVLNPNILKSIEQSEARIARLNEEIAKDKENGGKNVKSLEQDKQMLEKNIEYMKNMSYDINSEELAALKENADHIVLLRRQLFNWSSEQMAQLIERLMENNIQTKEFLSELDRMINMMMQEEN